jgi:hypothetical protein
VASPKERRSPSRLGEIEYQASADSSGGQPPVSLGGLDGGQDVRDPERQDPAVNLAAEPIEQGRVGGGAEGGDGVDHDAPFAGAGQRLGPASPSPTWTTAGLYPVTPTKRSSRFNRNCVHILAWVWA